jgi:hypothetical protein
LFALYFSMFIKLVVSFALTSFLTLSATHTCGSRLCRVRSPRHCHCRPV